MTEKKHTPENILVTRHGFDKSMMMQPCGLMWFAVYQAMEAHASEVESETLAKYEEAIEALKGIVNCVDNQNPTHENIWRIADAVLAKHSTKAD